MVDCERHHTGLPVEDIQAAVDFYTDKLGFELGFTWGDPPTIAGVNLGDAQVLLGRERRTRAAATSTSSSATQTCSSNSSGRTTSKS
jgi:catechol 2,3-dioxygenase-like lactoylglutathione lyase family enzyme